MIKLLLGTSTWLPFESVTWKGTENQASREIDFTIASNPYDVNFQNITINLGDIVHLFDDTTQLFVGVVTNRERSAEIGTASFTAKDFLHYLLRSSTSKVFNKKTPEAITKNLLKEIGANEGNIARTKYKIKKAIYQDTCIYDIIIGAYRKASASTGQNYMLTMDGSKVNVIVKGEDSGVTLDADKDITAATYNDTTDNMINKVLIYNKDGTKKSGKVQNANNVKNFGIYQTTYTKEEGVNAKKAAKKLLVGVTEEASVEAVGNVKAVAGKLIVIHDSATGLSGNFYITQDEHTFQNGVHTMSLSLSRKNTMEEGADGN
jgi:hypothetical protein